MKKGKIIIISAPSGTGKSTIINSIIDDPQLRLGFSISCTSRKPRGEEQNGREYYFLSFDEFRSKVEAEEFVEWEEVYPGTCYGTLKSEVERVVDCGNNLIMDIDVKGGVNVKKIYGNRALSIFITPPSLDELEKRLRSRATDDEATIQSRLSKSRFELGFEKDFDVSIVNDSLPEAVEKVRKKILEFIER